MNTEAVPRGIVPRGTIRKRSETCGVCKRRQVRAKRQRTCKECHAAAMKYYRASQKLYVQQLEQRVREIGNHN